VSAQENRIEVLQTELAALKQQRKEKAIAAKRSKKWVSVKKRMPGDDDPWDWIDSIKAAVLIWRNGHVEHGCYDKENKRWYEDDGTYCYIWAKETTEGITHWMDQHWRTADCWYPPYGPGIVNRIVYIWRRFTQGVSDTAHDMRPKSWSMGKAQLDKKVVFYKDASGKIMSGMPENLPAPRGYEKIICNSAHEAERLSELQRRQERVEHRRQQEQRGAIEAEFIGQIRSDRRTLMANARDNKNRDFLRRAEEMSEGRKNPTAYERESYLHAEAYEKGH
jgi:hypothetical protein